MELRQDQREVAEKLLNLLTNNAIAALQAPTGWGKTVTVLHVVRSMKMKAAWAVPRLSIGLHVHTLARQFGLKSLLTAGRERLCFYGYDRLKLMNACRTCPLNHLHITIPTGESMTFGELREMVADACPYNVQEAIMRNFDLVIGHYRRLGRMVRKAGAKLVVVDEAHNLVIPTQPTMIRRREVELILQRLGFREDEVGNMVRTPETLREVLRESLTQLVVIAEEDEDLRTTIENVVNSLDARVWFYDAEEDAVVAVDLPDIPRAEKMLFISATLPPSILHGPAITVRRGWTIKVRVATRYSLDLETVRRRKDEIRRWVREMMQPGTVIYTTTSREVLLDLADAVFEDEVEDPCRHSDRVVVLRAFGKYDEGVDLDCFKRLIILGLPLLPPNVLNRLRISTQDLITTKTVQLIGRIVRTATPPPETPEITLADKRYKNYTTLLRQYEIEPTDPRGWGLKNQPLTSGDNETPSKPPRDRRGGSLGLIQPSPTRVGWEGN